MAYTSINKSSLNFTNKLFTGNNTSGHAITGVGFQPDMVWFRNRSSQQNWRAFDVIRGATYRLVPNEGSVNAAEAQQLQAFGADGFTVGADGSVNGNTEAMSAYCWKAGGSASANTDGSINSTVSVNTTAGFSIVKWTGSGANATIGHGLGATPNVVIVKNLGATENWVNFHTPFGPTKYVKLNDTSAEATSSDVWNNTAPTSSVFYVGSNSATNQSGNDMIAYCFTDKTGYSKFGKYVGNGNADGTFVYTGFKPKMVIVKEYNGSGNWIVKNDYYDNQNDHYVLVNEVDAETSGAVVGFDLLSNGFKLRGTAGDSNGSSASILYMAFGQSIVGSNNIPCTAR